MGPRRQTTRRAPRALLRSFAALAEGVLPEGGPVAPGAVAAGVGAGMARLWPDLQPAARRNLQAMLVTVELAAVLRHRGRLRDLDVATRTRLCDHLERSAGVAARTAFTGLKTLILVLAVSDPELERAIGMEGWPPQLIRDGARR